MPRFLRSGVLALTVLGLTACSDPPSPPPPPDPASDAVFERLGRIDTSVVAQAFLALDGIPHTVESRFEMRDTSGAVLGTASRTVLRTPTQDGITTRVLSADSSGSLGDGIYDPRVRNPLPSLLPDDPPYLSTRTREHYRYATAPDLPIDGETLRVFDVNRAENASDDLPIRHVRYLLAPDSDQLRGLSVERKLESVLFDEANTAEVVLRPGPDGTLLPWHVLTQARVDTPGAPPLFYRLMHRVEVGTTDGL